MMGPMGGVISLPQSVIDLRLKQWLKPLAPLIQFVGEESNSYQ
jgi:hypothetical protein